MSLTAVLRKSASTAAPLAGRIFRVGQRDYHSASALFPALKHQVNLPCKNPSLIVPFVQCFCSTVTETQRPISTEPLLRALESEIKVAQETVDYDHVEEIPKDYPFKIDDNAGQQTDNDVDDGNDDSQRPVQSSIPLVVTISKKCGTCLEFNCVAYADEIKIDSMSITGSETSEDQMPYDGPNFHDFDEKLKKGFHKYLEIRGIKASTTNFLHEYMINKDSREYMGWLSNLKQFIEA
ncbi:COMPLEMENT COMPONENT 1 [Salix purpurea]|uniref:COMPLEMENT COMPONENT 1 n=1 Tax=Salix purpurea TaxID=77065 RepID=A0A9Q0TUD4_SALPP|nr:COMPLEMENT COMPONENT 1 [Salix purpurea]